MSTTRYHKLAANYLAFIHLASIRLWLRANETAPYAAVAVLGIVKAGDSPAKCSDEAAPLNLLATSV